MAFKRAPLYMRDMLSSRNSEDRWNKPTLNDGEKWIIEQALSEMLERKHNDPDCYRLVTGLISKVRHLTV